MVGTCRDIYDACEKGKKEEVERFIRAGVGVNEKNNVGMTPLHLAAWGGYKDLVKLLLENGANIDEKNKNSGITPILWAAGQGHKDIVKLLVDRGANIDVKNDRGVTPVFQAAEEGHTDIVMLLLSAGADPYIADRDGRTARDVDETG